MLTQYISNYREAILKLQGVDELQKLRGFLRGLDANYRLHVNTQDPETLEKAIKHAQKYDDDHGEMEQDSYDRSKWKGESFGRHKFYKKRQASPSPKESKKPKQYRDQTTGSLSLANFEKAQKQKKKKSVSVGSAC